MTSTAPVVLDFLVATTRAALTDTDVLDGPVVSGASLPRAVTIGYADDETTDAIDGLVDREGFSEPYRETYSVNCAASVLVERDVSTARAKAFALMAQVVDAVRSATTRPDTVLGITPSSFTLRQEPTSRGLVVRVLFALEVDAYTTTES